MTTIYHCIRSCGRLVGKKTQRCQACYLAERRDQSRTGPNTRVPSTIEPETVAPPGTFIRNGVVIPLFDPE